MTVQDLTLDIELNIDINASPEKAFEAMLHRLGEGNTAPDGSAMPMVFEAQPGGRWYRDRGNGIFHLWGFLQVIKPAALIEISGPMFMSYPANNHLEIKFAGAPSGCHVTLRHRAIGMIEPSHRQGLGSGWRHMLAEVKKESE